MPVKIEMDMPKSCSACCFCSYIDGEGFADDYYACAASGDFLGVSVDGEKRHPKCPLRECK